jgi:hypothetical protein
MISRLRHSSLGRRSTVAVLVGVLLTAGAALAYFKSAGSGTGSASAGTTQAVTLTAGTPSTQLYPGGQADVALTISNPNPVRVHIGSLSLNTGQGTGGFAVDGPHSTCGLSTLGYTTQTNSAAGWFIPPKVGATNGSLTVDLSGSLSMTTSAASACQGANFTVYLTAGP